MLKRGVSIVGGVAVAALLSAPVLAQMRPDRSSPVGQKEYRHPDLHIPNELQRADAGDAQQQLTRLGDLGSDPQNTFLDLRSGRWGSLMPARPMIPGTGVGNSLTWEGLGIGRPESDAAIGDAAWNVFRRFLAQNRGLGIEVGELARPGIGVHDGGQIVQFSVARVHQGVAVRDSRLVAVLNHGNLVLFGADKWGTINTSINPTVPEAQAKQAIANHVAPVAASGYRGAAELVLVPLSAGALSSLQAVGRGYDFRLAWVIKPKYDGELGNWEGLVDAHSGELLSFVDTNAYQSARRIVGGVFPVSNDGAVPDGIEQPGTPMPFADIVNGGTTFFADTGGNLGSCVTGSISSALNGRFVKMTDTCGAVNETSATDIDMGASAGTNCTVPAGGHSLGDTHATRTGYYELNKIKEGGRGQLPNNAWLQQQLTANMNLNQTCNAFWDGSAVNFFRSGGGCNNTGELAGVFDHEWGHGMDNNDVTGTVNRPQEGIADIYAALRINQSCLGRNFLQSGLCGGYGDPCTAASGCDGVRDVDFAHHVSGLPHDLSWIPSHCGTGGGDICGGEVHCEGVPTGETIWDLFKRDLPSVFGMNNDTALELATRMMFLGGGPVGDWYQCVNGSGGCPATSAYKNFLAVDDDNGNINDGTPHMVAVFQAFARHGIACNTPAAVNSGCAAGPTTAPVVSATPVDRGAALSWPAVPGAIKYKVFRTEGVFACDFGKAKVAEIFGTSYTDVGLQNGRPYSYGVMAVGLSGSCLSPMSACTNVTPVSGANLNVDPTSVSMNITSGDGDVFLDNCENATANFTVSNIGSVTQTNVRIQSVTPLSHPAMPITGTSAPAASVASCASAAQSFNFRAVDVAPDQPVTFRVDVTSDQLSPSVRSQVVRLTPTEGNFQFTPTLTSDFEATPEGWSVVSGTFNRTNAAPGGAGGAGTFYFQSSSFLDGQCDEVHSPLIRLTATSTLSLFNNYNIEPLSASWYDRANVARVNEATGVRTVVIPSAGRPYEASGPNGPCGMTNDPGWAAANPTWGSASFNATALGSATVAGVPLRIDIKYGTDPAANNFGFRFDQVTLTNFDVRVNDAQADICTPGNTPPNAVDDSASAGTYGPVTVNVLGNDSDIDGNCMRVTAVTTPANGEAFFTAVGCPNLDTVTYIPHPSCGNPCNDSFTYTVSDGQGGTDTATVTLTVTPVELQQMKLE